MKQYGCPSLAKRGEGRFYEYIVFYISALIDMGKPIILKIPLYPPLEKWEV